LQFARGMAIGGARLSRLALAALGVAALCLVVLIWPAVAAPPNHLPDPREVTGLNHACGAAVDSQGNVYVSSAGDSQIKVLDPELNPLATISNSNAPCGLAVNGRGRLFVTETATGKVVRYRPAVYPFAGLPSYGPAETIDEGHGAEGIAVDPADDRLYVAEGTQIHTYSGRDEVQRIAISGLVTGGDYTLTFKGTTGSPIPGETTTELNYNATAAEIEAALEGLAAIEPDDVAVVAVTKDDNGNPPFGILRDVTFSGKYEAKDIVPLEIDTSELVGGSGFILIRTDAWADTILKGGQLTEASGVAAYTYAGGGRYLFAADEAGDEVKVFSGPETKALKLRRTITGVDHDHNPGTAVQEFGFGTAGAYLAVDPGNGTSDGKCTAGKAPVVAQACTAGHLLVHDAAHQAIDEFEATGEFLDQLPSPIADGGPTAMAIDRSGGLHDGTIYATSGAGAGARLVSFKPLRAPERAPLPELTEKFNNGDGAASEEERLKTARSVATDSHGYVYVATGALIQVLKADGEKLEVGPSGIGIAADDPADLAVDSECNVYVLELFEAGAADDKVAYYEPSANACPPVDGTTYTRHEVDIKELKGTPDAIVVNPADDHLLVTGTSGTKSATIELDSAANGSGFIRGVAPNVNFGPGPVSNGVHGATGNLYVSEGGKGAVSVARDDPSDGTSGGDRLARITGAGCPAGPKNDTRLAVAVDQSNGHVLVFENSMGTAREYDASGACVTEFSFPEPQGFTKALNRPLDIAIDSSAGPSRGTVYIAFDDSKPGTPDLWVFAPLTYGDKPEAITGAASGIGGGKATLNGTVNPRGFALTECYFEYTTDAAFLDNGFTGPGTVKAPCVPGPVAIGSGKDPVSVQAELTGLVPEERYRFRLVASNEVGLSEGKDVLFGPPLIEAKAANPIHYTEATLRASLDPSGLATKYHFEYRSGSGPYSSTPVQELPSDADETEVTAILTGLSEGTAYFFRLVATNEANDAVGQELEFRTQERREDPVCANAEYRFGLSANLPDCRAYELVTPANTNGLSPVATSFGEGTRFNNWLAMPRGAGAGDQIAYLTSGTLPGFEGNGNFDGYLARRTPGNEHPPEGWQSELLSPTYAQAAPDFSHIVKQFGFSADQLYSFWNVNPAAFFPETLAVGTHLRTPAGFEVAAQGPLGTDLLATPHYLSAGGAHVIFGSDAPLHPKAPADTMAIYDRPAGSNAAQVISLLPGDVTPTQDAAYVASTEDGAAILFRIGSALYLRRNEESTLIADAANTFAGIADDGSRIFYAATTNGSAPAPLHSFDVGTEADTSITSNGVFVHVSADGSVAFFTSKDALTGTEENENGEVAQAGAHNLYAWEADTGTIAFVSHLHPDDFVSFAGDTVVKLNAWTTAINPGQLSGRTSSPTRSTPGGEVFVFQSHAQLTGYENDGKGEIYRYDPAAPTGEQLSCPSCDPSGAPPSADAMLGGGSFEGEIARTTLIASLTDSGEELFFQSRDRLLPEDANGVQDVYEWRAPGSDGFGAGACEKEGGCLALISSGQGEISSYLYGMSADGHDVFIRTPERLVGLDVPGSPSIYDARVGGGIPEPPAPEPCQGDACQPLGDGPPTLPTPASTGEGSGNVSPKKGCPKGKHKVKAKGKKPRCVKKGARRKGPRAGKNRKGRR
jgi:hypothetical protein